MRIPKSRSILLFALLASSEATLAELPGIEVVVTGAEPGSGTLEISIFDSPETFMKEPYQQVRGTPDENGELRREIVALPEGDYAVVAVHDANDNGQLDKGFLGFGAEPYGFSNDVRPLFFRPDFDEVKIRVDQPGILVEIDLD